MPSKMKLLLIAANRDEPGMPRLRLDKEQRHITDSIRGSLHGDAFEILSEWAVRPSDLEDALLRHRPHIVHIISHGSPESGIIFERDDLAEEEPSAEDYDDSPKEYKGISPEALARLFATLSGDIRLVFLNLCYTKEHAEAISEFIDYAIGLEGPIEDRHATAMAGAFYRGLAYGLTVPTAFDLAVNHLKLENFSDLPSPVLHARHGSLEPLLSESKRAARTASAERTLKPRVTHAKRRSTSLAPNPPGAVRGTKERAQRRDEKSEPVLTRGDLAELAGLKTDLEGLLRRLSAYIEKTSN